MILIDFGILIDSNNINSKALECSKNILIRDL